MARQYPDLINDLAIIQGEDYLELVNNDAIQLPGDLTDGIPTGQIRTDYLENGGILLASFSFEDSVYDEENDVTTIKPYLTNEQTSSLRITSFKAGKTPSLRNCYVYDFEIDLDGIKHKLAAGFVQVKGEVTGVGTPTPMGETFLVASNNLSEITDPAQAKENLGITEDLANYATTEAVELALANKEDADPTILKESDIDNTVQAYDPNTVIDSEYSTVKSTAQSALQPEALNNTALTGIPTAPTAANGTNTTQIATTAFVLANGGGGGSGVANGVEINGVANFWQTTAPITRIGGGALVDGDIWYKSDTQETWYRSGIYWVNNELIHSGTGSSGFYVTLATSTLLLWRCAPITPPFELIKWEILFSPQTSNYASFDASNYWTIGDTLVRINTTDNAITGSGFIVDNFPLSEPLLVSIPINTVFVTGSNLNSLLFTPVKVGVPASLQIQSMALYYRKIYDN